jgi:SulP family sulfate permease
LLITIVGFVESNAVTKMFSTKYGYSVSANRELVALGLANLFGSFFGAFPCFASLPRSIVNDKTGAKTNISTLFSCILVILALEFLLPYFRLLPKVVMASIIMVAAFNLIELEEFKFLFHIRDWISLLLVASMFVVTMVLGIETGIFASLIVSIFIIVKEATMPYIAIRRRKQGSEKFENFKVSKIMRPSHDSHMMIDSHIDGYWLKDSHITRR